MPVMGGPEGAHGSDLRERNVGFALTTNGWWSAGPLSLCAVLVGPSGAFHRLGVGHARAGALGVGVPPVVGLSTGSSADEF